MKMSYYRNAELRTPDLLNTSNGRTYFAVCLVLPLGNTKRRIREGSSTFSISSPCLPSAQWTPIQIPLRSYRSTLQRNMGYRRGLRWTSRAVLIRLLEYGSGSYFRWLQDAICNRKLFRKDQFYVFKQKASRGQFESKYTERKDANVPYLDVRVHSCPTGYHWTNVGAYWNIAFYWAFDADYAITWASRCGRSARSGSKHSQFP